MVYAIDAAIFLALAIVSSLTVWELKRNHILNELQGSLQDKAARRREAEERRMLLDEEGQEKSLFYKLDLALFQSGMQKRIPFMTSEMFAILSASMTVGAFILLLLIKGSFIIALAAACLVMSAIYMALELKLVHNTEKIEEDILKFANLLDNYSKSSDDIVVIMDYTWAYLSEPLKSAVRSCCNECRISGDITTAFRRLEFSIRHKMFGELVRNLELCSRYNANYSAVVRKNKEIIKSYLAEKEIRMQMANSSRVNILILYIAAAIVLKMMQGICEESLLGLLISTLPGNFILILCIIVILYSGRLMLVMGKGGGS